MTSLRLHPLLTLGLTLCVVLGLSSAEAATTKIMSWNALNYPSASGASRSDDFRTVIADVDPDIVVMQEINNTFGAETAKTDIFDTLAPGQWTMAPFTNGNDSDNALFFKSGQYVVIEFGEVNTFPRETDWWRLRLSESDESSPGIVLYSTHLKASTGSDNVEQRRIAARAIRDDMILRWGATDQPVLVMGDFNLYTSSEAAYGALTGNPGELQQMFDPIDTPGSWSNNAAYTSVHTQSTRTTSIGDGGSTGGMDDRFDFILVDADLEDGEQWDYVPGSYRAVGQDGNRLNSTVNAGVNGDVSPEVADALYFASDHLPVVLELLEPAQAQFLPTSFALGSVLQGLPLVEQFQVRNTALAPVDDLDYTVSATDPGTSLGGNTTGSLGSGEVGTVNVLIDTSTPRVFTGGLQLTTDDPGRSDVAVPFEGSVVRPSAPSLSEGSVVTSTTVTVETAPGASTSLDFTVANVGADALQARVYVANSTLGGGDAARFSLADPPAYFVDSTPVERRVDVDLIGLAVGDSLTTAATLVVQDDFLVEGAQSRGLLVVVLRVIVKDDATDAPSTSALRTALLPPTPSPFNPRTTIAFDLADAGRAVVDILDVRGRRVRTLVQEFRSAGRHAQVWDGTDDTGQPVASGVYLVRLRAADTVQVRRAVLVR